MSVLVSLKNTTGPHDVPHHIPPTGARDASAICKYPSGHPSNVYDIKRPNVKLSNVIWVVQNATQNIIMKI